MGRLFRKIYRIHRKKLKYINNSGRKLLITFAGVPGSGKTVIAKELENKLKAVRINSIDVEKIYISLGNERDIPTKRAYIDWLMNKIVRDFKNKTIILDAGIERRYDGILKWVEENGYDIFVIGVNCRRKTLERRIIMREGEENAKNYFAEMDRWIREYNRFRKLNISDIEINTEEDSINVWIDKITEGLKKKF
jgi:cytidylate kinase